MAIRRVTAADFPAIRAWWDTYRSGSAEYAREVPMKTVWLMALVNDPSTHILMDPATTTLAIGSVQGGVVTLTLLITGQTGVAAVTAADRMAQEICRRSITAGMATIRGQYVFPAGVNVETTRAVRYFNSLTPPLTKRVEARPDGTFIQFTASDPAAWLVALLARTP